VSNYTKTGKARRHYPGQLRGLDVFLTTIFLTGMMFWSSAWAQQAATISHGPILGRLGAHEIGMRWILSHSAGSGRDARRKAESQRPV
jgi:hypothetical protein